MLFCFCKISGLEDCAPELGSSGSVEGGNGAGAESAASAAGLPLFQKLDTKVREYDNIVNS
jgi:hypothetical protein